MTRISDVMTTNVQLVRPGDTLLEAAKTMAEADVGSLPVADGDRLVGMLTDRDIAIRGVALGRGPDARVREIMSDKLKYCYDDEDVSDVAENMADLGIRRLPVVSRDKRLVGIVSLANIVQCRESGAKDTLLQGVAQPH